MPSPGYRPQSAGRDAPLYNPERDLAYITPTLIRVAIDQLDPTQQCKELREFLESRDCPFEVLAETIQAYAEGQRLHATAQDAKTARQSLLASGFYSKPYAARLAVFSVLGEMLTGAYFMAIRDVTFQGKDPVPQREMAEFAEAARAMHQRAKRTKPVPLAQVQVALEEAQQRRATAEAAVALKEQQICKLTAQLKASESLAAQRMEKLEFADREIAKLLGLSLWGHLRGWWRYWMHQLRHG